MVIMKILCVGPMNEVTHRLLMDCDTLGSDSVLLRWRQARRSLWLRSGPRRGDVARLTRQTLEGVEGRVGCRRVEPHSHNVGGELVQSSDDNGQPTDRRRPVGPLLGEGWFLEGG